MTKYTNPNYFSVTIQLLNCNINLPKTHENVIGTDHVLCSKIREKNKNSARIQITFLPSWQFHRFFHEFYIRKCTIVFYYSARLYGPKGTSPFTSKAKRKPFCEERRHKLPITRFSPVD